jgi:hypothetical protein
MTRMKSLLLFAVLMLAAPAANPDQPPRSSAQSLTPSAEAPQAVLPHLSQGEGLRRRLYQPGAAVHEGARLCV